MQCVFDFRFEILNQLQEDAQNFTLRQMASEMVQKSFVKIKIEQGYTKLTRIEDTVKTTGMTILSSVGAALNLWSGITVLLVIELIEMCVRLVSCCSKTKTTAATVKEDPDKISKL